MKLYSLILLAALAVPVAASPVHIALRSAAAVLPDADGFFTLASVAAVTGGDSVRRTRLAGISVGRAPLSGETRFLTRGDLALKLRQAGCDPDKDIVLEGAGESAVTSQNSGLGSAGLLGENHSTTPDSSAPNGFSPNSPALPGPRLLLRSGAPVTILIQSGALTITATGIARESGGAGDTIRVHRDGVMTDLIVTVLDAQTVQLEI